MTEPVNDAVDIYIAVGGETQFTYTFEINTVIAPALHPITVETRLAGVLTTLVEGVDFTVTGAGNPSGGTIVLDVGVFPAGAIAGVTWEIKRTNPVNRVTDFQIAGDFFALEVNDQLDYITQILQDQKRDMDSNFANSIRLAASSLFSLGTMLDPIAGTFLRATAGGNFDWVTVAVTGTSVSVDETDTDATKNKLVSNLLAKDWEDWKDLMTTKGDLVSFTTTRARLGIGTEGQRLNPNVVPTIGMEWGNQIPTLAKATTYIVAVADQGKLLTLSGASFTVTLPVAATAGDGFVVGFKHGGTSGSQQYTLDGDTAETIDGVATKVMSVNNEEVWLVCDASNWKILHQTYPSGSIIQQVYVQDGATNVVAVSVILPIDDTVPQNTEGDEYMILAITPTNTNNNLLIEVEGNWEADSNGEFGMALFRDAIAGALSASYNHITVDNSLMIGLRHRMLSPTAGTAITFKVRAGRTTSDAITFNANTFGGIIASHILITEYAA